MKPITLTLPYPPSTNRIWDRGGRGVYKSFQYKVFLEEVALLARAAQVTPFPKPARVRVLVDVYRPRRTGDLDNRLKATLDALQGVGYENDSQIAEIHARLYDDKEHPRVVVTVEKMR